MWTAAEMLLCAVLVSSAAAQTQQCFFPVNGRCWQGIMMDGPNHNTSETMKTVFDGLLEALDRLHDTVTIPGYTSYLKKGMELDIEAATNLNSIERQAIDIAGSGNESEMEAFLCERQGKPRGCQ
jgi:hypothetical protein